MDRKKTILIAVMINAGLLAVLFVAALTTHEETSPPMEMTSLPKIDRPLFPHDADIALQQQTPSIAPPPIQIPIAEAPKSAALVSSPPPSPAALAAQSANEEPPVHKLPPLVPETLSPPPAARAEPSFLEVVVKKGDSLDKIAKKHRTTVDEIIKINQLPSSFLRVGQVLKLPAQKTAAIAAPKPKPNVEKGIAAGPEYYTVKVGDNPWTIAMRHHMKVEELLKLNSLNEEKARKLKPGDRLRIR